MSRDDTERGPDHAEEHPTDVSVLATPYDAAGDLSLEEDDDDWGARGPAKGIRLALPTAGLAVVALVAAGFWGGAVVQKNHGSSTTGAGGGAGSAFAARFRSRGTTGARGATGGRGFGGGLGFGGAGSSAAAGTISVVTGKTLYILTSAGALVKVTLGPSATITRTATTPAVGLRPGDTVVVQGTTTKSGDVAATSVSATAP
jgi:hypothetical protein